jgi:ATP-dependent exoDNAse (exonuclease V) beta subunit
MVTSEQFTLNRSTGEFTQSLTIKDGRKIEIIHGYCGKLTKAPF